MTTTEPAVASPPTEVAGDAGGPPGPGGPGGDGGGGSGGDGLPSGGGDDGRGAARGADLWWRNRGLWVIVAVVVAVVVALIVGALWPSSHHPAPKAVPTVLPPVKPLVGAAGGELVALLQAGQRSSYHARYHVTGDPATIGGSQDLETWNAPPRQRADTTRTSDGHTYRSETFTDATSTSLCVQQDAAAWSCQRVAHPSGGGVDAISTSVIAATSGQPVAVADTTISGRKVRCFTIATASGSLRLCATPAGVPVVISNSAVSYQLVALDTKVGAATFKTPAPVRG